MYNMRRVALRLRVIEEKWEERYEEMLRFDVGGEG